MRKFSALIILLLATVARAASLDRDLGHGLAYHRVHHLPADLPTAETARLQPCVLDLRYVTGDAEAAAALVAWVKFHATPRAPVFVLANAATSHALVAPLASSKPGSTLLVIGGVAPGFTPDIALKVSAELERQAYDALETGATVERLIAEASDKPRNDEAKLAKDRTPEPAAADATKTAPEDGNVAVKFKSPAPPIDLVLQRAVQLHRTLLALKKL